MVEELRNKWCDDLEDLLQCPICMNRPKTWIYQCIQGHHICEDCKTQLSACPTCSQRWSVARNRFAENLCTKLDEIKLSLIDPESEINKLLIPDKVSVALQTDFDAGAAGPAGKQHVDTHSGAYPCRISGCNVHLFFHPLVAHFKADHSSEYTELLQADGPIFQHVWMFDFTEQMIFDRAFLVPGMGTFILKLSTDCFGNFSGFILMVHNGFIAKSFTYQLEVSCCANHNTSKIYTGEVCSCRTPAMVLNEKCLQIKRADIRRMLDHQNVLNCTVLLGKKPQIPNGKAPPKLNNGKKKPKPNNALKTQIPSRPRSQPPRSPENRPFPGSSDHQPKNREFETPRESRPQTAPNQAHHISPRQRDASLPSLQFANRSYKQPFTAGSATNILSARRRHDPYRPHDSSDDD